jgi:hypothetical protein
VKRGTRPYARFYYDDFIREFPAIYADDAAFSAWMRLLTLAEKLWPIAPELPRHVKPGALRKLVDAKLVKVSGMTYTVRGLDAERSRRHHLAKSAADSRWSADSSADGNAVASADEMPRRDEYETSTPLPPTSGGRRADATNPRALAAEMTRRAEEADQARKRRRQQRYISYSRGEITEAQRVDMDERDAPLSEITSYAGVAS